MAKAAAKPKPKAPPTPAPVPGSVFAAPVHDGRWTAYVIARVEGDSASIAALDWLSDAPPTLADVRDAPLLRPTHHAWNGRVEYVNVSPPTPPRRWQLLGVITPPDLGPCNSYGGWPDGFAQVVLQRRWETEVPEAARAAYKACTRDEITIDRGAGLEPIEVRRDSSKFTVGKHDAPLAPGAAFDWGALAPLAHLTDLTVYGDPAGLVEHVRANPLIEELSWLSHGRDRIDLSTTRLTELCVDASRPCELVLPDTVRELRVSDDASELTVVQPLRGARMQLSPNRTATPPRGLDRLRALRVSNTATIDLAPIAAAFPALEELGVYGKATRLAHVERLGDLPQLRNLVLNGCYGLDAAAVPPASTWPGLDRVEIGGHRKADAALLRERLGAAPRFELTGGKTDDWLAANLDNPFRDWIDRDARAGKTAAAAWRKARAALSPPPAKKAAEKVLRAFVDVFNTIDARTGIDTIDREEIGEAFFALATAAAIDDATAEGWFDAWRDF